MARCGRPGALRHLPHGDSPMRATWRQAPPREAIVAGGRAGRAASPSPMSSVGMARTLPASAPPAGPPCPSASAPRRLARRSTWPAFAVPRSPREAGQAGRDGMGRGAAPAGREEGSGRSGGDGALAGGLRQTPIRWIGLIGVVCSTRQQAGAGSVSQAERKPLQRHPACLTTRIGRAARTGLPGLRSAEREALYARGARWLAGVE